MVQEEQEAIHLTSWRLEVEQLTYILLLLQSGAAIQSYKLINKLINKFRWSSSKFISSYKFINN